MYNQQNHEISRIVRKRLTDIILWLEKENPEGGKYYAKILHGTIFLMFLECEYDISCFIELYQGQMYEVQISKYFSAPGDESTLTLLIIKIQEIINELELIGSISSDYFVKIMQAIISCLVLEGGCEKQDLYKYIDSYLHVGYDIGDGIDSEVVLNYHYFG